MIEASGKKGISVKKMSIIGVLGSISIILGMTPLGFIPVSPTMKATIMHIPVIIGAIVEGPVVGMMVGLIFGIFSMIQSITQPTPVSFIFWNPLISVLPRIAIGITSYYGYIILKRFSNSTALQTSFAGAIGTITNTVGVLGMAYLLYGAQFAQKLGADPALAGKMILGIGISHGIPEIIIAMMVVSGVCKGLKLLK